MVLPSSDIDWSVIEQIDRSVPAHRSLLEAYIEQDLDLQSAGFHPTSDWWLAELGRFWEHPTAYCLVEQVGRRGGKSSTMARIAVAEVVDRHWTVPPGDPCHVFAFFSIKLGEAVARLDGVEQILEARGIEHHRGTDKLGPFIRLESRPLEWRAMAANFRTAVGFTCIGFCADELARWIDTSASANPASHVLASVRPAMATHLVEGAHEYLISSPWAEEGAHFEAVDAGNDEDQCVSVAATWVANPTLTEADCGRLCRREQAAGEISDFDRDYRAIPMPLSAVGRLDPKLIDWVASATRAHPGDQVVSGSDLGFKVNSSAQAIGYLRDEHYHFALVEEWRPTDGPLKPSVVCRDHRKNMLEHKAQATCADGHYRESLVEAFADHELSVINAPPSVDAVVRLRTLMRDNKIHISCSDAIKQRLSEQLRGTQLLPTQNGMRVIMRTAKDGSHCDLVAALALACWQRAGTPIPKLSQYEATLIGANDEKAAYAKRLAAQRKEASLTGARGGMNYRHQRGRL